MGDGTLGTKRMLEYVCHLGKSSRRGSTLFVKDLRKLNGDHGLPLIRYVMQRTICCASHTGLSNLSFFGLWNAGWADTRNRKARMRGVRVPAYF